MCKIWGESNQLVSSWMILLGKTEQEKQTQCIFVIKDKSWHPPDGRQVDQKYLQLWWDEHLAMEVASCPLVCGKTMLLSWCIAYIIPTVLAVEEA